jgi:endoglucanase
METISVAADPYAALANDALRYFYLNRAGTDIGMPRAGDARWTRKAGHETEIATCFSGTDKWGVTWPACDGSYTVTGGWYDAGDYGKYTVPTGNALWMLLNSYELAKANGHQGGVQASVLLDEARWGLEWIMSMQVPDGTRLSVPNGLPSESASPPFALKEIDASGLAFSKVHERKWLPLPLLPENADEPRYVHFPTPPSPPCVAGSGSRPTPHLPKNVSLSHSRLWPLPSVIPISSPMTISTEVALMMTWICRMNSPGSAPSFI